MALATVSVTVAVAGTLAAGAQGVESEFRHDPSEGPPGTIIQVSGRCALDGQPADRVFVRLARRGNSPDKEPFDAVGDYFPRSDGTWSGGFTVPFEAPPDAYLFRASCVEGDAVYGLQESTFTVLQGDPTTTTTTVATTTTTAPSNTETVRSGTPPPTAPPAARTETAPATLPAAS